jgi:hypothetical protein
VAAAVHVEAHAPEAVPARQARARGGAGTAEGLRLGALPTVIGNRAMARFVRQLQRQSASPPAAEATGGLTSTMLTQIARRLRAAMEGWGTDEEAIYSALSGRTQEQVAAIARTYKEMYRGRDLLADLKDELSDSELRRLAIFNPPATPPTAAGAPRPKPTNAQAEQAAHQLHRAMDRWGTDEEAIFAALTGRTKDERDAIKTAYVRITNGRSLEADLRDELSGSELTEALRLLNQGELAAEDELHLAMAGLGTDEDRVYRVLESMRNDPGAITAMEQRYRSKYGDLVGDLRGDFSGDEYARAMAPVRPVLHDVAFEDCDTTVIPKVRSLIPTAIAKTDKAIQVLSVGWSKMTAQQRTVFNTYFDPANRGEVDARFVSDVLANFRAIRREFDDDLTFECMPAGGTCTGTRLYYTHWGNVFVCPYFKTEPSDTRRARDIVHELAHNAMHAVDRPYFGSGHGQAGMSPRGSWPLQIPVLGYGYRLIGGIAHLIGGPDTGMLDDTLYHPDAYSMFAFEVP